MLKDKYNMSAEENVLYEKRNMVDSIWKSANLEGISVTFSEAPSNIRWCKCWSFKNRRNSSNK